MDPQHKGIQYDDTQYMDLKLCIIVGRGVGGMSRSVVTLGVIVT